MEISPQSGSERKGCPAFIFHSNKWPQIEITLFRVNIDFQNFFTEICFRNSSKKRRRQLHFPDMFSTFALTYWNHGKCKFILDWTNVGNSSVKRIGEYLLTSYPSGYRRGAVAYFFTKVILRPVQLE